VATATFTFIDLFAGIGGFHLGLEVNGGECVYANEWDKFSAKTYGAWFPNSPLDTRDLRTVSFKNDIPNHDVLAGGFPCQPFSIAGVSKKNSMGIPHGFLDGKQGNLFLTICKIVRAKKPKVIFLENVRNLVSHDKGKTWKVILAALDEMGYEVKAQIIDAAGWVPQHRERIYIVAFNRSVFTKSEIASFAFPSPSTGKKKLKQILEKAPGRDFMLTDHMWAYLKGYAEKHRKLGNGFGYTIADIDGHTRTLSARYYKDGSEILIRQPKWKNPRRLTPLEAGRLMGFDRSWAQKGFEFPQVVSNTQAYRQFGNAVCPQVTGEIGREIARLLAARKRRLVR
jgi:DNA (cytosine-5)-methyltransferase 1